VVSGQWSVNSSIRLQPLSTNHCPLRT